MQELITYIIYHKESGKVVAQDLSELETIELIYKMIEEGLVKDIELSNYRLFSGNIDILNLLVDIRKQGIFDFEHTWHTR
ncbi:hypothetical protein [Staphylococcus phage SaGU1]|uniref:Terminal repeat-encoded protein n=8 Tax=Kayvirus TaxID=1857843 RepID=A0A3Q9R5D5_9CAUD|nr:hypothetical protein P108_0123 [Staphylococcus phage P108]ARQ95967.1 hypothetical protein qdsa002_10 [Staphylococcus phage qdsa002]AUG85649.1 hypothetical protein HSA30_gp145 [Staphylococcus phage HSA30]AXU40172.1 hypothetical protein VBSavMJYL01_170 [Staphylococcus phage VB_SavM_JYL01]AZU97578.1 hypothetical protein VBSavMJYL02_166 [Staphylococcus phage VB-SavM-JYL02]QEQ93185.1 hypothetical protein [Staphylococcus phage vB_SauH_IME522]QNH71216.1 hypothetical protein StAP1_084 [Staphylococ